MLRLPFLLATMAVLGAVAAPATSAAPNSAVTLAVPGLPSDPAEIVWERLPLLPSERVRIFTGVENVDAFNHHPTLIWHGGRFFAAWSNGAVDEDASGQRILFATSRDGRTWTQARPLSDRVSEKTYTPCGFWRRDGELYALASLRSIRRTDSGFELFAYRWDEASAAFVDRTRIAENFFAHDAPKRAPDGQWLMLGKSLAAASADTLEVARGGVASLSAWSFGTLPSNGVAHDTFWHPLADGRLVAIEAAGRLPARRLIAMFSSDAGATWSPPVAANFPDSDSRLHGVKLSNGTFVLISNPNTARYRIPLSLAISRDGLRHDGIANLRIEQTNKRYSGHAKSPGYSYARGLEHDGRLWVIYSSNKEDIELSVVSIEEIARFGAAEPTYSTRPLGPELIVDNRDAGFSTEGAWSVASDAPGYQGSDYAFLPANTTGSARWHAAVPQPGAYDLYLKWATIGTTRTSPMEDIARIEIRHPGGVHRTTVDQSRYGGVWTYLVTQTLRARDTIEVKIIGGGDGITVADAIKLVRVAETRDR